jgi:hypothetical protein
VADLRANLASELAQLHDDTFYTEKAHFSAATEWGTMRTVVGVTTTLAGAASTATIIANQLPALAAIFAVIATIGGALQTFLRPGDRSDASLKAGRELGAIRVKMRQAKLLQLPSIQAGELPRLVATAAELASAKAEVDARSPAVSNRHYNRAKKQIES